MINREPPSVKGKLRGIDNLVPDNSGSSVQVECAGGEVVIWCEVGLM